MVDKKEPDKKELKGIEGWLAFFIFALIVSLIISLIGGVEDISYTISSGVLSIIILDILYIAAFLAFGVYTIYLLMKFKKNAVSVAKMFVSLIFLTNLIGVIFSALTGQPIGDETTFLYSSQMIFRSLIFGVIWFLYLIYSKRVKVNYPVKVRKTYPLDIVWFLFILAVPVVIFSLALAITPAYDEITTPTSSINKIVLYPSQKMIAYLGTTCTIDGMILGEDNWCHIPCGDSEHYCIEGICLNNDCIDCGEGYVLEKDGYCYPSCGNDNTYCVTGDCYNNECVMCPEGYYLGVDGNCYLS